jgi:hypothetical protein
MLLREELSANKIRFEICDSNRKFSSGSAEHDVM